MGKARFLYNNLITDEDMITVSSLRLGMVTSALKEGTGSATFNPAGSFSGAVDLEYEVEIDSVAGGAEVGQATFKWKDGTGGWNATGVATSSTPITLNNGVQVSWASGSGNDFVLADKWYFKGINLFNPGKMIDLDRDHRCRSAQLGSPNTYTFDLGSAQEVKALIIQDHNFTSGVTLTLEADAAATFDSGGGGTPQFSEAVTYAAGIILHYLSVATTKRYWRLKVTDAANPDGYIEIGELYLGSYFEAGKYFSQGFLHKKNILVDTNRTSYGRRGSRFYNLQDVMNYNFDTISESDANAFYSTMLTTISDRDKGIIKAFWLNEDSGNIAKIWLVELSAIERPHKTGEYYTVALELLEVVASV